MADEAQVTVRVTRLYPRGGRHYRPGEIRAFPESIVRSMEEASPPYCRRVRDEEAGEQPTELVDIDGTEPALELAEEHGLDLRPRAGQGSGPGGRIYVEGR